MVGANAVAPFSTALYQQKNLSLHNNNNNAIIIKITIQNIRANINVNFKYFAANIGRLCSISWLKISYAFVRIFFYQF